MEPSVKWKRGTPCSKFQTSWWKHQSKEQGPSKNRALSNYTDYRFLKPTTHGIIPQNFLLTHIYVANRIAKGMGGSYLKHLSLPIQSMGSYPPTGSTHTYLSATSKWTGCWKHGSRTRNRGIKTHIKLSSFLPLIETHNSVLFGTSFHSFARDLAPTH